MTVPATVTAVRITETGVDLSGYPPTPVLWFTAVVDTLCIPLQCREWRQALGISSTSWLSQTVPFLGDHMPNYPSFQEYLQEQEQSEFSWQALYQYAFETPTTALSDLSTPTAALVLCGLVLLLRGIKSVVMPVFSSWGRYVGRLTHGVEWELQNEERILKFGEYVFRLIYHSLISFYGVWYFWDKPWWATGGTKALFQGFPYHPVETGMTWYYLLQAAYNFDAMLSLILLSFEIKFQFPLRKHYKTAQTAWVLPVTLGWSKTVRGDFQEMMIHHVITNMLVIGSSRCRLTRIGSMVFLVHDLSDVPVDLSKLANFLKWKWTTLSCFLTMVAVWMVTRLYILPFIIYRSILTESHYLLQEGLPMLLYMNYRHIFYVLVGLLILLHVAWFVMFLQIFATFLHKHECHDLSEHKQGEQQHGTNSNHNSVHGSTTSTTMLSSSPTALSEKPRQRLHSSSSSNVLYGEEKKDN